MSKFDERFFLTIGLKVYIMDTQKDKFNSDTKNFVIEIKNQNI